MLITHLKIIYDIVKKKKSKIGAVVANRLSENANWTILLIEAGENEVIETDIPIPLYRYPQFIWNYWSEPQKYSFYGK